MAQRFSFSMSISGEALSGYAGASDALANSENPQDFDSFLKLVNKAMGKADDVLNDIFKLLNDFFDGTADMKTRAKEFMDGLSGLGLLSDQSGQAVAAKSTKRAANPIPGFWLQHPA